MNQKKVLGLLFALIATVFMFILVVSALPSDVYETPESSMAESIPLRTREAAKILIFTTTEDLTIRR